MNTVSHRTRLRDRIKGSVLALKDAVGIVILSSVLALLVNWFHPRAIPFIATQEYETMVPCPEPGGEVKPLEGDLKTISTPETFVVDARLKSEFEQWSVPGAMSVPFDYLDPTPEETIKELARRIAKSRATRVVVYGDGELPDSGEQLGKEISGHGIKNVYFVKGGAPALRAGRLFQQPKHPEQADDSSSK